MLAVIDYGAGNLRSVLHALNALHVQNIRLVHTADELEGAEKIILPGVGAFGAGMQQLAEQGLIEPLKAAVRGGIPYLGICLGMQFLFDLSEEMGTHEGLGLLPGKVVRFPDNLGVKVPHMGWNEIVPRRENALTSGLQACSYTYFVHSYYCEPTNPDDVLLTVDYGLPVTAAVQRDNIYGVQFHPEKSQTTGLKLLQNFLELA